MFQFMIFPNFPLTFSIANWSHKVDQTKMDRWVETAFNAWAIYSNLKFKRVYDTAADIILAFGSQFHGDRYPFDGPGNVLAHAFYPYEENSYGGKEILRFLKVFFYYFRL
jgi:Matrixin